MKKPKPTIPVQVFIVRHVRHNFLTGKVFDGTMVLDKDQFESWLKLGWADLVSYSAEKSIFYYTPEK